MVDVVGERVGPPRITVRQLAEYEPQGEGSRPAYRRHDQTGHQLPLPLGWPGEHYLDEAEGQLSVTDEQATRTLLRAVVEVLSGRRPLMQLRDQLDERVFAALQTRTRTMRPTTDTLHLRSVHAYQPAEGIIEACGTVQCDRRFQALAARLQQNTQGWRCTVLRLI